MSDLTNMFEEDTNKVTVPSNINEISRMAEKVLEYESAIKKLEEKLKIGKELLLQLTTVDLPTAMQETGVSSYTLNNGSKIEIDHKIVANIKKENKPAAHTWLRENKHDAIIKNTVVAKFDKGQDEYADSAYKELKAAGYNVERKEDIHYQTLGAWVREQKENQENFPEELFGVHEFDVAKVTPKE